MIKRVRQSTASRMAPSAHGDCPASLPGNAELKMKKLLAALLLTILGTTSTLAVAHGGGLDKNGCHHDRKNGGRHCH